mmetsp:Transcript_10710/g.19363  ORF Transcript_10710/g.19363 Transcript_10710/m.19363 type:complete len:281 (-) Transcript_10710:969-1811(-)
MEKPDVPQSARSLNWNIESLSDGALLDLFPRENSAQLVDYDGVGLSEFAKKEDKVESGHKFQSERKTKRWIAASGKRFLSSGKEKASQKDQPKMKRIPSPEESFYVSHSAPSGLEIDGLTVDVGDILLDSQRSAPDFSVGGELNASASSSQDASIRRFYRAQIRSAHRNKLQQQQHFVRQRTVSAGVAESRAKEEDERKTEERLIRNRQAALKSRQEKKEKMRSLELHNEELQQRVQELTRQNEQLQLGLLFITEATNEQQLSPAESAHIRNGHQYRKNH